VAGHDRDLALGRGDVGVPQTQGFPNAAAFSGGL
jgi:hypothetical protein